MSNPRKFDRTQSDENLMERKKQATEYNRLLMLNYFKTKEAQQLALNKIKEEQSNGIKKSK